MLEEWANALDEDFSLGLWSGLQESIRYSCSQKTRIKTVLVWNRVKTLKWILNFREDRKQQVVLRSGKSGWGSQQWSASRLGTGTCVAFTLCKPVRRHLGDERVSTELQTFKWNESDSLKKVKSILNFLISLSAWARNMCANLIWLYDLFLEIKIIKNVPESVILRDISATGLHQLIQCQNETRIRMQVPDCQIFSLFLLTGAGKASARSPCFTF